MMPKTAARTRTACRHETRRETKHPPGDGSGEIFDRALSILAANLFRYFISSASVGLPLLVPLAIGVPTQKW